ncbi:MAG: hypothetical protein FWB72_01830 [Firmicutes bacterium]|nr:hypothetical protein [Bacillota bacterium]
MGKLVLPGTGREMNKEEMQYIDGGFNWGRALRWAGAAVAVAALVVATVVTFGAATPLTLAAGVAILGKAVGATVAVKGLVQYEQFLAAGGYGGPTEYSAFGGDSLVASRSSLGSGYSDFYSY